jgi:hypothetical protein
MAGATKTKQGSRSLLWLQGLLCGLGAAFATPTAVLGSVLLAPGLAMLMAERTPGRPMSRTMLLFGAAASVGPVQSLWSGGHTVALALSEVSDIAGVGLAWAAAAVGWLLIELAPVVVRLALEASARAETKRLQAELATLEAEWEPLSRTEQPGSPSTST